MQKKKKKKKIYIYIYNNVTFKNGWWYGYIVHSQYLCMIYFQLHLFSFFPTDVHYQTTPATIFKWPVENCLELS